MSTIFSRLKKACPRSVAACCLLSVKDDMHRQPHCLLKIAHREWILLHDLERFYSSKFFEVLEEQYLQFSGIANNSARLAVCLSACLQSACLPAYLSACLLVCLSASLLLCFSASLLVCVYACLLAAVCYLLSAIKVDAMIALANLLSIWVITP
jgi:hypothetical protein